MDLKELQKQFDKISKQVEKETESQPVLALLMNTLLGFFRIIFGLLEEQIKLNQILQEKLGKKDLSKDGSFVKPIKEQTNECSKVPFE